MWSEAFPKPALKVPKIGNFDFSPKKGTKWVRLPEVALLPFVADYVYGG
jgi:hypothetical protein